MPRQWIFNAAAAAAIALLSGAGALASPSAAFEAYRASLSEKEAKAALAAFDDRDRGRWRYTPGKRGGLTLAKMDPETRAAAMALVRTLLSAEGMAAVEAILLREQALGEISGAPDYRDPEKYYLAVFGAPGGDGPWGVRFEGHHLSINATLEGDRFRAVTPLALGADPERHARVGAPLLAPFFDLAETARQTGDAGPLLAALLALFPAEPAATPIAEVEGAFAAAEIAQTAAGYRIAGQGALLELAWAGDNHIHVTLEGPAPE